MIVSRQELAQILRGSVGEAVTRASRTVGETLWIRADPRQPPACLAKVVDVWPVEDGFSVLLEKTADNFEVRGRPSPERPRLRLTRAQRLKLFERESPHIGGTGTCPVEPGQVVRLSARVSLRVLRVDFKQSRWALHYELRDTRDAPRLLRRTPPAHREGEGYELPADPAAQEAATRDAAEESAYTSSLHGLVDEAGEAPPKVWLDVRAKAIREFESQRRLAKQARELREKSKAKRKRAA